MKPTPRFAVAMETRVTLYVAVWALAVVLVEKV